MGLDAGVCVRGPHPSFILKDEVGDIYASSQVRTLQTAPRTETASVNCGDLPEVISAVCVTGYSGGGAGVDDNLELEEARA